MGRFGSLRSGRTVDSGRVALSKRLLAKLVFVVALGLPLLAHADSTTFATFANEQDYHAEIRRLEGEIARIDSFGAPYRTRIAETESELTGLQASLDTMARQREAQLALVSRIENSYRPADPHLVQSIERVREQRDLAYQNLDSNPSAIRTYDTWDARLRQLERQLARDRAQQIDEDALRAARAEVTRLDQAIVDTRFEINLRLNRRDRTRVDLERAIDGLDELEQELANLRSQAPRALARMRPPVLESFETSGYNAEWIGEGRDDDPALQRIEIQMLVAQRQIMGADAELRRIETAMNQRERELNDSTRRYVELTENMSDAGFTEAALNIAIETTEAGINTVGSSGGNPVGILVNSGIELATRYDSFIMAYRFANDMPMGDLMPAQRMAVASEAILAERQRNAGNHVIEAYRAYGLPVPELTSPPPARPRRATSFDASSLAANTAQWSWNRVQEAAKSNAQDTVSDIAREMVETGLVGSLELVDEDGWRRVLRSSPGDSYRIVENFIRRANPHYSEAFVRSEARAMYRSGLSSVSRDVLRQRFRESFRRTFAGGNFRERLSSLKNTRGAVRSAATGMAFSLSREAVDQIEDLVRDGIMERMVAEEVVWLQTRREYHMLGARRQIYALTKVGLEEYLQELRAEYARLAGNVRGRSFVVNESNVFAPGEYTTTLTFSQEVTDVVVVSQEVTVGEVTADGGRSASFTFTVPERTDASPVTARFAITASHPRTEKGLDADPATRPYFDSGSQGWRLWEQTADTNHAIRLQRPRDGTAISIILDDSGSMEGGRFAQAQEGILGLLASLRRRGDVEVALWTFSNTSAPQIDFTSDLDEVKRFVEQATPGNATPLTATIESAGNHLFDNSRLRRRVLYVFSDGEDSDGRSPADAIERLRRRALLTEQRGF